jgi:oligopeptide/dipeptide ABC transporter ATP-binding protein
VTIQAQILELLTDLKRQMGMSVILITHDFGVVAETCQRVMVMYAGRKVEEAATGDLFRRPLHPYTRTLMQAVPRPVRRFTTRATPPRRLEEIPGSVPGLSETPPGCRFAERCGFAVACCRIEEQAWGEIERGHYVACWQAEYVADTVPHG